MTPLVAVTLVLRGRRHTLQLKLEGANPTGSLKDRTAAALIADLEQRGALTRGSVIVESTSGNLGVALAAAARARGYGLIAIVDPHATAENVARMRALGAHVDVVDRPDGRGGYLLSRIERVHEWLDRSPLHVWPNQYENPANPRAHELGTGPELLDQAGGALDAVLAPVSTGGTLAGLARHLRRASAATLIVAVDACGSVALGGLPGARLLTGIGASRRSHLLSGDLYDDVIRVGDAEAFACCHALRARCGLTLGGSSGAVVAAAGRLLAERPELERVACICPDRGERYVSSIYDPAWLRAHGVQIAQYGPIEAILPRQRPLAVA